MSLSHTTLRLEYIFGRSLRIKEMHVSGIDPDIGTNLTSLTIIQTSSSWRSPVNTRVGWKVDRLTMMQWSNLTKCGLFFQIVSPAVHMHFFHRYCSAWILVVKSSHPDPRKSPQLQNMTLSLVRYCFPAKCFIMLGEQNSAKSLRKIWRVINQFKATITHSSHCNHKLVYRSIALVKQESFRLFSMPFWNVSKTTF